MRHARAVPPLRSFSEASLRVQSGRGPLRSGAKRAAVLQRTAAGAAAYGRWRAVRSAAAPNARTHSKAQARFPGSQRVQTQGLDFGIQARGCRVCGESERMPPARTATTTGRQIASAETGAACGWPPLGPRTRAVARLRMASPGAAHPRSADGLPWGRAHPRSADGPLGPRTRECPALATRLC